MSSNLRTRYVAIALVSASVLLFEIAITRILSVIMWYHFAFLAISLAMLGLGLPGVWYTLRPPTDRALRNSLIGGGIALPASIILLFALTPRFPDVTVQASALQVLLSPKLMVVFATVLGPFLCLGSAVCVLLMQAEGKSIGRMYGCDLLGATAGALCIVPFMHVIPTPWIVAGSGLLPLAAALLLYPRSRAMTAAAAALLLSTIVWGRPYALQQVSKASPVGDVLYEKWTPTARILVSTFRGNSAESAFGWGMGAAYESQPIEQLLLTLDQIAGTPITGLQGAPSKLPHLFFDVTSVGYQLEAWPRVCIIGSGGGRDILTAVASGATEIDAVELNPHIVDALSEKFGEYSGKVYQLPGVRPVISEGRSFLTRGDEPYDFIQISMIDSWAATSAGAFALSENYLYTVEALRLYWRRLAPGGMVSITRWLDGPMELESPRLALMMREALRLEGVGDPKRHIGVVQGGWVGTFLLAKDPLTPQQIRRIDEVSAERGFARIWPQPAGSASGGLVPTVLTLGGLPGAPPTVDLSPPTDDAPFFFQTLPIFTIVDQATRAQMSVNARAVIIVQWLVVATAIVTVTLFFLPFLMMRSGERGGSFWRGSAYFICIGLGFMLVEVPWIQRFILYLGHPSYATTIVLTIMLLGAGAGSTMASRLSIATVRRFFWLIPLTAAAVTLGLTNFFAATLGSPLPVRIALTMLVLLPPSFCMGFAFPAGIIHFGDGHKAWYWAMNGAASVLASVCSLALAMAFGFTNVSLIGATAYVLATLCIWPSTDK